MFVKICGIQTFEAAHTAVQYGADFIGIIFADSRRCIAPEKAAEIIHTLPEHVKSVGVFVNETVAEMEHIACIAGLDYIQLHGSEPPEVAAALSHPVMKAFPAEIARLPEIKQYPCDYVLLDHPSGGGTGRTIDWQLFKTLHQELPRFLLAGGLTPENVRKAIKTVHPAGVDVSSGVETNGQKDPLKIRKFLSETKNRKDEEHDKNENSLQ